MSSTQIISSMARLYPTTAMTMSTCARQVSSCMMFQFLKKRIQRTKPMMMMKMIQKTLTMLNAKIEDGDVRDFNN